ncbi:hypothetical protein B0I35DRAFT_238083 [Stachybotrys elegans]|uniref:tRNA-intron lyase n=1 Tax=Stachybotrys elegans TaxID=80388 RepID=A0A8K0WS90_9HYPO|nr:hypothetical protein B0I35DRAFT_238083 [Stachybotrys elegans]
MAATEKTTSKQQAEGQASSAVSKSNAKQPLPDLNQIYALPAPIRTFPLPTFYPNNPVSLIHIAYEWCRQVLRPPAAEPSVVHHGVWSPATVSVHITEQKSIRALWEQGFYGKGSLSRSEPNWLKREQVRRGLQEAHVSEIFTVQRREERNQFKWERARQEQEAIRQTRLEEAQRAKARELAKSATKPPPQPRPPVGPLEILALPNSMVELESNSSRSASPSSNGLHINGWSSDAASVEIVNESTDDSGLITDTTPTTTSDGAGSKPLKRQKSVRFSPKVESTTFQLSDPPSPSQAATVPKLPRSPVNGGMSKADAPHILPSPVMALPKKPVSSPAVSTPIVDKEHLQLIPEEAFFLTFGLGALTVNDASGQPFKTEDLLRLFRQYSSLPPRDGPDDDLEPDDGFLVNYAVYHHFRSMGWVPRPGIKFGVDWLLYTRGPVFDHAEFGLVVIPSYTDPWWNASGKQGPQRTWQWLHTVLRVLSHAIKSMVIVYVDIPPPPKFEAGLKEGFAAALRQYKVREVMIKRWSTNRNR